MQSSANELSQIIRMQHELNQRLYKKIQKMYYLIMGGMILIALLIIRRPTTR